jgi:asparagine synthase (glutamine-hydrolysing)
VDAAGGLQPMERGPLTIVFNGEIYNHAELRVRFSLSCQTRSDTETLLLLYERIGPAMLPYLDGMFALAIHDERTQELFLARDRMGEKPLYYFHQGDTFTFASELNALAASLPLTLDEQALPEFLVKGWVGPDRTVYRHVFSVPIGYYMLWKLQPLPALQECKAWWNPLAAMAEARQAGARIRTLEEGAAQVLEALDIAVKRRIESSDLPVGCFLSGGIDSGLVTALASRHTRRLHTFTFNFEGVWDESDMALAVAKKYHTDHTNVYLDYGNLADDIGSILLAYGEPFADDSAIPSYYVAREAKKYVTVVLNGDGGDEVFGGYRRYVPATWPAWCKQLLAPWGSLTRYLRPPASKMSYYNYLYRLLNMQQADPVNRYLAASTDLFWEEAWGLERHDDFQWLRQITDYPGITPLQKARLQDYGGLLPEVLLPKIDIATMQHALESRTVFFAPEVLAASNSLPDKWMVNGTTTKLVLRHLARQLLPAENAAAPKRGFEPPLDQLVNGVLRDMVASYVLDPNGIIHTLLGRQRMEQVLHSRYPLPADKRSKLLYTAFCLAYWCKHRPAFAGEQY